jgi:hypothetical protein
VQRDYGSFAGAVALSHRAISTPQIFRHEAEDGPARQPSVVEHRWQYDRFYPDLIDRVERPNSISQEVCGQ